MRGVLLRVLGVPALFLTGVLLNGCGPGFDPPSRLSSLRVLGVQKDKAYAQPGDTVHLTMLWEDASPKASVGGVKRPITIAWSPPCANPAGDLYYGCFQGANPFGGSSPPTIGVGQDTTSVSIPPDVIIPRPAPNAPYGVVYVFFAVCAGKLSVLPSSSAAGTTGSIPIACLDPVTNEPLGSDDFVAGYTTIYSFQGFSNKNPIITGFEFNGTPIPADQVCVSGDDTLEPPKDDSCVPLAGSASPADIDCSNPDEPRCIPTCADDGAAPCPGYALRPTLTQADNQEQDSVSAQQLGRNVTEQMWIDYYTDAGGFKSAVRLLNDATTGWNDSYGTEFYASKDAQVSRVWALVHDNRGGVAWAGISVKTQ